MLASLLTLILGGCAWVSPTELDAWRQGCTCADGEPTYYPDRDGDSWGRGDGRIRCLPQEGWVEQVGDCDDENPAAHPEATEVCDGVDDDCDGEVDERGADGETRWYQDADGDGWGDDGTWLTACSAPSGYITDRHLGDCDDADAAIHPGAEEVCGDLADNDCDGTPGACRLEGSLSVTEADLLVEESTAGEGLGTSLVGGAVLTDSEELDMVLGAPSWVDVNGASGAVLVFSGPLDATGTVASRAAQSILLGASEGASVGRSLAVLPNHGGDGTAWLAVGCAPADPAGGAAGAVYLLDEVVPGTTVLPAAAAVALDDAPAEAAFGFAMDGGADADGDGRADLLVGGPGTAGFTGEARLFLGPVSSWGGIDQAQAAFPGPSAGALAGIDVALCPDVDGDGLADALVGAPGYAGQGAVALYLSPTGDTAWSAADVRYVGSSPGAEVGSVAAAGDTDADGYGDYLVGAPGQAGGGAVWLMVGSSYPATSLTSAAATVVGSEPDDRLGASVATAGDFDGDGHADITLGAPQADDPWEDGGNALLLYGPITGALDMTDGEVLFRGGTAGAATGSAVGTAGDLDGDGFADLLIGAPGAGQVALFFGQGW